MKKIMLQQYGSVDVMQMTDAPLPSVSPRQVLVKTAAIGVNDPDVIIRQNGPFPTMPEAMKPVLPHSLGQDFSGVVAAVGEAVSRVQAGDHVVGLAFMRTYGEYILLDENDNFAPVPKDLDLQPLGGFYLPFATAWAATVRDGQVQAGQKVLIHGAAGGVGSLAVQLAKHFGAYVIASGSGEQSDYMKSLGADETIDYKTQDFTRLVRDADLVVNLTGQATLDNSYAVVKQGGRLTSVHGMPDFAKAQSLGISAHYSLGMISLDELTQGIALYAQGKLKIAVNQAYPFKLAAVKQAHQDFVKGGNWGRRVIYFPQD